MQNSKSGLSMMYLKLLGSMRASIAWFSHGRFHLKSLQGWALPCRLHNLGIKSLKPPAKVAASKRCRKPLVLPSRLTATSSNNSEPTLPENTMQNSIKTSRQKACIQKSAVEALRFTTEHQQAWMKVVPGVFQLLGSTTSRKPNCNLTINFCKSSAKGT